MPTTNIRNFLADRAEKYGDQVFFISPDDGREITYRELNDRIDRTARILWNAGIRKGDKIGLLLPNRIEFLYAYFGAMKIGAVAGPINILLKPPEIRFILENSEARALFTMARFLPLVESIRAELSHLETVFVMDSPAEGSQDFSALIVATGPDLPEVTLEPDDEAMIIYTSGTTGNPKGVLLSHKNLLVDASYISGWHRFRPGDRAMCILPLFHVNGEIVTVMTPLHYGGSVVMPEKFSASTFWQIIARYRVNWFSAVPTNLSILLNSSTDRSGLDLSCLRFCICGAAPLPVEVQRHFELTFRIPVIEGYGLSETTCYSSFNPHPPEDQLTLGQSDGYRKFGSIGLPMGNEMKVFDDQDQELPPGVPGEIVIRGENVMKGYFKRPEANAEAFRNGWFHSGDIGYRDADGYFYITDRKKDMIIRGGENIYPREIDEVLYTHPAVRDAATVGVKDPKYGEEVKSFVVLKDGASVTEQEIIEYCRARLADYKCPKAVQFVPEIPKGPSGKLLRRKLIELYESPPQAQAGD